LCTSIAMKTTDFYFGRNLDLEYSFGERIVITPRQYPLSFRKAGSMKKHYAMIGMAAIAENYPLYAEACNEMGLCIAGLNFPENAFYPRNGEKNKVEISPFELPLWVLSQCGNSKQAKELLQKTQLIDLPFGKDMPLTPLHWHIADDQGSIVLESTREGMMIYDNPAGVLTNNPPFPFQRENLRQYLNLTVHYPESRWDHAMGLSPFGVGMGTIGLPGDYSPASRFVRAAFLRWNSRGEDGEKGSVGRFFHLLSGVAMMDGIVETKDGKFEKTSYSCCMNASRGIYYYTSYENRQITGIDMQKENLESGEMKIYPLLRDEQIRWENEKTP